MFLTDNVQVDFGPRPEDAEPGNRPTPGDWLLIVGTTAMSVAMYVAYVWHLMPPPP